MSRRDTLIIAVLVNAALLMILFATAMRSDSPKEGLSKKQSAQPGSLASAPPQEVVTENLLNEIISSVPTFTECESQNLLTFEEAELALALSPVEILEPTPQPLAVEEIRPSLSKKEERFVNVTVKKGDYLGKIANANNTTVAAIMQANQMASTQLKVGQVLKVPLEEGKQANHKSSSVATGDAEYYTVKEGDSPWLIASRNKVKLDDLLRLNGLDEQKAKKLRPGDKLKIR